MVESLDRAPVGTNLPLGLEEEKVWGKKFKIRVTSKKTGKKLDLNITFKKSYDPFVPTQVELGGNSAAAGGSPSPTALPGRSPTHRVLVTYIFYSRHYLK